MATHSASSELPIAHIKKPSLSTSQKATRKPDDCYRRVSKYFKYAPGVSCLLGPLDAEAKVKKQVQRQQRKPVGQVVAPKILEVEDREAQVQLYL